MSSPKVSIGDPGPMKLSVAILFYNQVKYVEECLDSVLRQKTTFPFEMVIADDGSTDGTRDKLTAYQQRFPDKIKLIFNEKNLGLLLNRNKAYENCQGDYIALLDGDDYFLGETRLQEQVDFLDNNPDYGVVYGDKHIWIEGKGIKALSSNVQNKPNAPEGHVYEALIDKCFLVIATTLFRRELVLKHADLVKWHELGFKMDDYPMWLEFAQVTKFHYIDKPLAVYRFFASSLSRSSDKNALYSFWISYLKVAEYMVAKYPMRQEVMDRFYLKYHTFYLEYAFSTFNPEQAKKSVAYFKQRGMKTWLHQWYYLATVSPLLWFVLKVSKRFIKPLRLKTFISGDE